jgi:ketosteroid isomerase-like protein
MNAIETVERFLERINARHVDRLLEMMTDDHVFTDSLGHTISGQQKVRAARHGYYGLCPDYWVSHSDIFQNGSCVAVFGSAGGTIAANGKLLPENKWRTPAAWYAVVQDGLLKEWRVYADNKQVYDILAKPKRTAR